MDGLVRPWPVQPFLYFDRPTLFRPKRYFDLNLTSTFLATLYFDQISFIDHSKVQAVGTTQIGTGGTRFPRANPL